MKVSMPTGNTHGWGIAGTYLSSKIAALPPVDGVTLHCVSGHHFAPSDERDWNRINIGYCFFEHEILAYRFIPQAARQWDHIVAGSTWCEHHLKIAGMQASSTILQGIDPAVFQPAPPRPDDGRFVVFTGGKFEFRKGHDLIIAAMRIFMARHSDVWLACAWHNHWPNSIRTMEQSRCIDFQYRDEPCEQLFPRLLAANGIPTERTILYPVMENRRMQAAYAASDMGLFPNRCEGGNNMVMCEYMACGRPVIASTMTGHQDVVKESYALCLSSYEPVLAQLAGDVTGVWFEPAVDEIVALLEQAYRDRQALHRLGTAAAAAMTQLSWDDAAKRFHRLAVQLAEAVRQASTKAVAPATGAGELFAAGRYEEAEASFRAMLAESPLDPLLHNGIATVLDRMERYPEAVLHYEKALIFRPDLTVARFNLANTLKRMGKGKEAISHLEQAVTTDPKFIVAWQNLALCRFDDGDPAGAAQCLQQVLLLDPSSEKTRIDLGEMLLEARRYREAITCFDQVLTESPGNDGVLNSKGTALQELDDLDGAEACYRQVLEHDPDNVLALNNMATVLRSRALPEEAIMLFDQALQHVPGDGQIIFNRSLARLTIGDFTRGWEDYEKRFARQVPVPLPPHDLPRWQGEPLNGQRLLIQAEQGYGDTFQFARYLPLLAEKFGSVVFEVQDRSVKTAMNGLGNMVTVIARGDQLPPVDYKIPLLSLPGIFGTEFGSIPCPEGYLKPDRARKAAWEQHLGLPDGRLRVGLVWGGRKTSLNANRSMLLADLREALAVDGIRFISLQLGDDATQAEELADAIEDVRHLIHDFGDTAALVACLDLVITIDTAVAHLAGALGVPTWVMLKLAPDWRWFLHRNDSPWYESIRLFRQQQVGDWFGVASAVAASLVAKASEYSKK